MAALSNCGGEPPGRSMALSGYDFSCAEMWKIKASLSLLTFINGMGQDGVCVMCFLFYHYST